MRSNLCCGCLGSADTVRLPVRVAAAAAPVASDLHRRAPSALTVLTPRTPRAPPTETRLETAAGNLPNGRLHLHLSVCHHLSVSLHLHLSVSSSAVFSSSTCPLPRPIICLHLSASRLLFVFVIPSSRPCSALLLLSPPILSFLSLSW